MNNNDEIAKKSSEANTLDEQINVTSKDSTVNTKTDKNSKKLILVVAAIFLVIILSFGYLFRKDIKNLFSKSSDNNQKNSILDNSPESEDNHGVINNNQEEKIYYLGNNPCISDNDQEYENGDYHYKRINNIQIEPDKSTYNIEWNIDTSIIKYIDGWQVELSKKAREKETLNSQVCSSINEVPIVSMNKLFSEAKAKIIDISSFDTTYVFDMSGMFSINDTYYKLGYYRATKIIGYEGFNTSKVADMSNMFAGSMIDAINVSKYNTSNVKDMSGMFKNADAKEIIGLNNFDTSKVTDMSGMFTGSKLNNIDVSKYNLSSIEKCDLLFAFSEANSINIGNIKLPIEDEDNLLFAGTTDNIIGNNIKRSDYIKITEAEKRIFFKQIIDYENEDTYIHISEYEICNLELCNYFENYNVYKDNKGYLMYPTDSYHVEANKVDVSKIDDEILYIDGYKYIKYKE